MHGSSTAPCRQSLQQGPFQANSKKILSSAAKTIPGNGGEPDQTASTSDTRLTTNRGAPLSNNQNSLKAAKESPRWLPAGTLLFSIVGCRLECDQEKWHPVFLQNRATNRESRAATELRCFHLK